MKIRSVKFDAKSLKAGPLVDPHIYWSGLRLNALMLAIVFGLFCGVGLMTFTYLSIALTGEEAGRYLNLLGVVMWGYSATPTGAWIGFFWAALYAGGSAAVVYFLYARAVGLRLVDQLDFDPDFEALPSKLALRLSGRALGLATGVILALQLFISTLWLLFGRTPEEIRHAKLLAQYLPGYSLSVLGAIYGCFWVFVFVFLISMLFAGVYNSVARLMNRRKLTRS